MKSALMSKDAVRRISQRLIWTTTTAKQTIQAITCHQCARPRTGILSQSLTKLQFSDDKAILIQKRSLAIIHGRPGNSPTPLFDEDDDDSFHAGNDNKELDYPLHGPNPGLASIISQGYKSLEKSAADIESRTRNSSLTQPHKKGSFRAGTLEPRQLAEGQRILDTAIECLEDIIQQSERGGLSDGQRKGLLLAGEPIVLLECVVNRNVKQAKLYWTLPYGILMDERIHYHQQRLYQQLTAKVQQQLVEGGGAKLLTGHVHAKLSSYYPPRIKMLPATDDMVIKAIEEYNYK